MSHRRHRQKTIYLGLYKLAFSFFKTHESALLPDDAYSASNDVLAHFIDFVERKHEEVGAMTSALRSNFEDRSAMTKVKLAAIWDLAAYGDPMAISQSKFAERYFVRSMQNYKNDALRARKKKIRIRDEISNQTRALHGEAAIARTFSDHVRDYEHIELVSKLKAAHPEMKRDFCIVHDRWVEGVSIADIQANYNVSSSEPYNAMQRIRRAFVKMMAD